MEKCFFSSQKEKTVYRKMALFSTRVPIKEKDCESFIYRFCDMVA